MEETPPESSAAAFFTGDGVPIEQCENMIRRSFRTPMVKFLRENLEKSGCRIGDNFFKAINCDDKISGGYLLGEGIKVCSNRVSLQDEVNQVVIHELIHAYDECRANIDWTNCAHHACSEIRAGHLSGDCHFKRELLRKSIKIRGHEQDTLRIGLVYLENTTEIYGESGQYVGVKSECVRRRAMKSVLGNPNCSKAAAKDAMDAVWNICYNDTKPFDQAP